MEIIVQNPSEAISFLEDFENGMSETEATLVCLFQEAVDENSYSVFTYLLSGARKLKHLAISGDAISRALGDALVDNNSLETIKLEPVLFGGHSYLLTAYFLTCLEKNTNLIDISLEGFWIKNEEADIVLNSAVLRKRLASIKTIILSTSKQIHAPFYRFSKLTELHLHFSKSMNANAVLRSLCYCEHLKKLSLPLHGLNDLQTFPKCKNELRHLFPFSEKLVLDGPFTTLLRDIISSNVAERVCLKNVGALTASEIRVLLAAAERKESGTIIETFIPPRRGNFNGDAILFAARLRSDNADWSDDLWPNIWI